MASRTPLSTTSSSSNQRIPDPATSSSTRRTPDPVPSDPAIASSSSDSYVEPEWCYASDCIRYTVYPNRTAAEQAVTNLHHLLLQDEVLRTSILYLRRRIVISFAFATEPPFNYRVVAHY